MAVTFKKRKDIFSGFKLIPRQLKIIQNNFSYKYNSFSSQSKFYKGEIDIAHYT